MSQWDDAVARLADASATLLGLWGEPGAVHLALWQDGAIAHLSLVLIAGVWLPAPLVSWFQHVAVLLG